MQEVIRKCFCFSCLERDKSTSAQNGDGIRVIKCADFRQRPDNRCQWESYLWDIIISVNERFVSVCLKINVHWLLCCILWHIWMAFFLLILRLLQTPWWVATMSSGCQSTAATMRLGDQRNQSRRLVSSNHFRPSSTARCKEPWLDQQLCAMQSTCLTFCVMLRKDSSSKENISTE